MLGVSSDHDVGQFLRPTVVLFLHGSGDSGPGFRQTLNGIIPLEQILPKNSLTMFPTAKKRPYTPMMGQTSTVWFDRPQLHYDAVEDSATLNESILDLERSLAESLTSVSHDPIVVLVGFSMGGSMALHLAVHLLKRGNPVHGVFVHSSFVGRDSRMIPNHSAIRTLHPNESTFRVLLAHGTLDTMVPHEWGRLTVERLRNKGYHVDFHGVQDLRHEVSSASMRLLQKFIRSLHSDMASYQIRPVYTSS